MMMAGAVASIELLLVAIAAPFLLFPRSLLTALATVLVLIAWGARWTATGRFSAPTNMNFPAILLLAATVMALYPSVDLGLSSSKVWGILLGVAAFFAIVNSARSLPSFWRIMWALFGGGIAVSLLALVGTDWKGGALVYLPVVYDKLPTLVRGVPGSGIRGATDLFNAREVGGTMAMLLPVGVAMALAADRGMGRVAATAGTLSMALIMLLTQSPSAVLGAFIGSVLVFGAWYGRLRLSILVSTVLVFTAGIALVLLINDCSGGYLPPEHGRASFGIVSRLEIWQSGLLMLKDMPFTGIGINTFPLIFDGFYPTVLLGREPHAHNIFLQAAVDLGIFGVFAFLWLLEACYFSVASAYRSFEDRKVRTAGIALSASITAYLIFGSIDSISLGAKPGLVMWSALGLVGALASLKGKSTGGPARDAGPASGTLKLVVVTTAAIIIAPLAIYAVNGGAWLNLGEVEAHKGVIEARGASSLSATSSPPIDALTRAEERLVKYLDGRQGEYHTYSQLGSVQGWLGKDGESVETMRSAAALAWNGLPYSAGLPSSTGSSLWSVGFAPTREDKAKDAIFTYNQWLARFPDRWEVYLQKALFLYYELNNPGQARETIREGIAKSRLKAPLEYLAREIK
ncbi:MAG: O-antigen ligase family protein [Dehalococcoidia bacterium]|nr:O-antigen ligase family protein [Dehalococcoidia bacterium]